MPSLQHQLVKMNNKVWLMSGGFNRVFRRHPSLPASVKYVVKTRKNIFQPFAVDSRGQSKVSWNNWSLRIPLQLESVRSFSITPDIVTQCTSPLEDWWRTWFILTEVTTFTTNQDCLMNVFRSNPMEYLSKGNIAPSSLDWNYKKKGMTLLKVNRIIPKKRKSTKTCPTFKSLPLVTVCHRPAARVICALQLAN